MKRFAVASLIVASDLACQAQLHRDDFRLDAWDVHVLPLDAVVTIEPPPLKQGSAELKLKDGTPGWRGPARIPHTAWVYMALRPDSLKATLADDPTVELKAGEDFALDPEWGAVAALPGSDYPAGTKVRLDYQYGLSRIDLVEKAPNGELVVLKGNPDKRRPLKPAGTEGNTPLFAVYLPNHATRLTQDMILPVDPEYDGVPPVIRRTHLDPVVEKLRGNEPVTIVFFGDSITAQQEKDFQDGRGSFVERFATYLREMWPGRELVRGKHAEEVNAGKGQTAVIMSGVGGDDTRRGLKRLDAQVLAHDPDLVVIMFGVNDENRGRAGNVVPVPEYRDNLETMVDRIRAEDGRVILMTPSMKNLQWSATAGNLNDYAQAMRDVAEEKQVCLVDAYQAWQDLPKRGYHYMVFLGNCLNHPVDLGHDLFARGLRAAFAPADQKDRAEAAEE